jgi:hypothetical protein
MRLGPFWFFACGGAYRPVVTASYHAVFFGLQGMPSQGKDQGPTRTQNCIKVMERYRQGTAEGSSNAMCGIGVLYGKDQGVP